MKLLKFLADSEWDAPFFKRLAHNPLLIEKIESDQQDRIIEAVETLCNWDIWSTEDEAAIKAMRSNTVSNVSAAFPKHTAQKLIKEITN